MDAATAKTTLHADIAAAGLPPVADAADYEAQFDAEVVNHGNDVDAAYVTCNGRILNAAEKLKRGPYG